MNTPQNDHTSTRQAPPEVDESPQKPPRLEAFPLVIEVLEAAEEGEPVWRPVARWSAFEEGLRPILERLDESRCWRLVDTELPVEGVVWQDGAWFRHWV
jgi:hypothetical protein